MTARRVCVAVAHALAATLALTAAGAQAGIVENAALRLEVSDVNGSIVSLRDRRTDTEFIADRGLARLFELLIPDASNYSRRIVSWKQAAVDVQARDSTIEISFEGLKPDEEQYSFGSGLLHVAQPVLDIDVRVTLALDGDHVTAALELTNRSLVTITGVAFPYVGGLPQRTATGPASVVVPSVSERVYTSTPGALSGQKALRYPGMLATCWLSYELPQATGRPPASLGLEVRSGLESQDAYFSLSPGPFKPGSAYRGRYEYPFVAWIHYPHLAGRGRWRTPPTLLHVHAADWHAVASEHREWYRAKAHMQRVKTRDNGLGFATYLLKDDENNIRWRYDELPALGAAAMEAGLRTIVVDGWRQREGPSNPAPFGEIADDRLGGAAALPRVIDELKSSGADLLFTFHPTLINVTQGRLPPEIGLWGVKTRRQGNQLPVDFLYHTFDYPEALDTSSYRVEIDPASAATDSLLRAARELRTTYGFRSLLLKGVGQQAFLSYNRHHGVPPQRVYEVGFGRLLRELRAIYGDGMLLTEGYNDLVSPLVDGAYTWDQSRHPEVLAYSMPWARFSNDVEALDYAAANSAFAHGQALNLVVDGGLGSVADYPEFARHLRSLGELRTAAASYYVDAEFRDRDGLRAVRVDPDVMVTVHANASLAKTAVVVANPGERRSQATFRLDPLLAAAAGRILPANRPLDLKEQVAIDLAPYEIVLVAIDGAIVQ